MWWGIHNWTLTQRRSRKCSATSAGCWWITLSGLDPAKNTDFSITWEQWKDPIRVADPYSRKILDPDYDHFIPG